MSGEPEPHSEPLLPVTGESPENAAKPKNPRLQSLDIVRGFTIFVMVSCFATAQHRDPPSHDSC